MAVANEPIYSTRRPNEPIRLYEGNLAIEQGQFQGNGDGTVDLVWTTGPTVCFEIPSLSPEGPFKPRESVLLFLSPSTSTPAFLSSVHLRGGEQGSSVGVRGIPTHNIVVGSRGGARNVRFHLVNFWFFLNPRPTTPPPDYDVHRVVFEGGGWRVTLQAIQKSTVLKEQLKADSGYAITHIGSAEKVDGSDILQTEAHEFFDGLHSFLSFARGRWSPPILYVGIDKTEHHVWEDWTVRRASPWSPDFNWFPTMQPECLAGSFPGFMQLWQDLDRRDILQVAVHWYIEANLGSGALEGAVILCQTGLERLAYYILVHERGVLTEKDFQPGGLGAAQRLKSLFNELRLPVTISTNHLRTKKLEDHAINQGVIDPHDVFVGLRNSIVHPDKKNRQRLQKWSIGALSEARTLGLWYFELVLLKWFGYSGKYANRLTVESEGEMEDLP